MLGTRTFPEAPVSLTAHIRVPHISKDALLVTGRGDTAGEAVTNLHAAIAAINAPCPPASHVPTKLKSLATMIALGLSESRTPGVTQRIAEAAAYVLHDCIAWHHSVPGACAVRELMPDDDIYHVVTNDSCTCYKWDILREESEHALCAHMIGVQWWKQLNAVEETTCR